MSRTCLIGKVQSLEGSFLTLLTDNKEEVKCYMVKKLTAKGKVPKEGKRIAAFGGYKEFQDGINYFVIGTIAKRAPALLAKELKEEEVGDYLNFISEVLQNRHQEGYKRHEVQITFVDSQTGYELTKKLMLYVDTLEAIGTKQGRSRG